MVPLGAGVQIITDIPSDYGAVVDIGSGIQAEKTRAEAAPRNPRQGAHTGQRSRTPSGISTITRGGGGETMSTSLIAIGAVATRQSLTLAEAAKYPDAHVHGPA